MNIEKVLNEHSADILKVKEDIKISNEHRENEIILFKNELSELKKIVDESNKKRKKEKTFLNLFKSFFLKS
jgi:hypothetical protein